MCVIFVGIFGCDEYRKRREEVRGVLIISFFKCSCAVGKKLYVLQFRSFSVFLFFFGGVFVCVCCVLAADVGGTTNNGKSLIFLFETGYILNNVSNIMI